MDMGVVPADGCFRHRMRRDIPTDVVDILYLKTKGHY